MPPPKIRRKIETTRIIPLKTIPVEVRLKAPKIKPKTANGSTNQFIHPKSGIKPMNINRAAMKPNILLSAFIIRAFSISLPSYY